MKEKELNLNCKYFHLRQHPRKSELKSLKAFLAQNLEMRLIRRLIRWDLRENSIYSGAVVYDCTFIARGHIYQNAAFMIREEFQGRIYAFIHLVS